MTLEMVWGIAGFSLAWFIVGVVAGRALPRSGKGKTKQAGRKRSRTRGGRSERTELYVGNLSYEVREKDLRRAFQKYGDVTAVRLIKNRGSGKSKGYGFVEMRNSKEAKTAIDGLNSQSLKGRRIVVNEAKSESRIGGK